jgi:SAM-dependent methyltransferase
MTTPSQQRNLKKAAERGEPSYVWRAGQTRRLEMVAAAAGNRLKGQVLDDGCGVGMYVEHLAALGGCVTGFEYDLERAATAHQRSERIACAAGENLPFPPACFDLVFSNEVIEHVRDDRQAVAEMVRVLRPGGRLALFCPNRGYPFETHGIYWRGRYHFGNIPLVNYLPRRWRDRLAPHVKVYSRGDLQRLFTGLPVRLIERRVVFGAYDNIIARWPAAGRRLRAVLQALEHTPLQIFGLSHFWVVEKTAAPGG